jgi:hypothetical protein
MAIAGAFGRESPLCHSCFGVSRLDVQLGFQREKRLAIEVHYGVCTPEAEPRVTIKQIKTKETQGSARAPHQDIR